MAFNVTISNNRVLFESDSSNDKRQLTNPTFQLDNSNNRITVFDDGVAWGRFFYLLDFIGGTINGVAITSATTFLDVFSELVLVQEALAQGGAVTVTSSVLPTGASTEAKQNTGNGSLNSIDEKQDSIIAELELKANLDEIQPVSLNGSVFTFSTLNSSTTQLASNITFTGTIESVVDSPAISLLMTSDQNMIVTILQYIDLAGTKLASSTPFTVYANQGMARSLPLNANYFQITAKNIGGSTTTTFQLDAAFGVIDSSDSSGNLPVKQATEYVTGTITTQNLVPNGVATANSAVELSLQGTAQIAIQVTGTYTGALSLQVTNDNSRWETITALSIVNFITGAYTATIASATQGIFIAETSSFLKVRVAGLAAVTGTATVTIRSSTVSLSGLLRSIPTGSNVIGAVTQSGTFTTQVGNTPNTTPILANRLTPVVSTTGDTGAKTVTGNGATQTNTTSKGVHCIINLGTVSGTTPTAVFKIQGSADSGTTWFDIPSATTDTLVSTGVFGIMVYPSLPILAGITVSGTTAQANSGLPRTWRVVWTIGGTTPSFTITNIQVNYII